MKKQQWHHVQKLWRFINLASLIPLRIIQKTNSRQMVHNSYIFVDINSRHTAHTIASKTGTYFGKRRDFLKLSLILYFRASFQEQYRKFYMGWFYPHQKTNRWNTHSKIQILPLQQILVMKKIKQFIWGFSFSKPVNLGTPVRKFPLEREGLETNNEPKTYSENITAAPATGCCMQCLLLKLGFWFLSQTGFFLT